MLPYLLSLAELAVRNSLGEWPVTRLKTREK